LYLLSLATDYDVSVAKSKLSSIHNPINQNKSLVRSSKRSRLEADKALQWYAWMNGFKV